jgi:hypothetical protein
MSKMIQMNHFQRPREALPISYAADKLIGMIQKMDRARAGSNHGGHDGSAGARCGRAGTERFFTGSGSIAVRCTHCYGSGLNEPELQDAVP